MINKKIFLMASGLLIMSVGDVFAQPQKSLIIRNDAVVVCRSKQCKSAKNMMTQEFLYNKLGSLLKNNINRRVLFCDADPSAYVCLNDAIAFEAKVGATQTTVAIPSALLVDTKAMTDETTQKFVLDYDLKVGETYPTCQASLNQLQVFSADKISIETPGFECRFTENGMTIMNASYEVNYIDFDYGILGAYYTVAVGQVSAGGQSGYALLRFTNPANANNEIMDDCGCVCNEAQNPPCQCEKSEPEVKTIIQEKIVTQYEVAPIEVYVKTKAPIEAGQMQSVRINGVDVQNVPVVSEANSEIKTLTVEEKTIENVQAQPSSVPMLVLEQPTFVSETQILKPGVPVVMDMEEEVAPSQVRVVSNWDS